MCSKCIVYWILPQPLEIQLTEACSSWIPEPIYFNLSQQSNHLLAKMCVAYITNESLKINK